MLHKANLFFCTFIFFIASNIVFAQENSNLVTYGANASTKEGDNDFIQTVIIEIPESIKDSLYLRIFDADCGGENDTKYTDWNTSTRFRFYGAEDVGLDSITTWLAEAVIAEDNFKDNQWFNLTKFSALQGEKQGDNRIFKLVVEGLSGDDANLYDINISLNSKRNNPPKGLKFYNSAPTIRLPGTGIFAEMRFFVPQGQRAITVYNFDLSGAKMGVETAFRSNLPVVSSGQDQWSESQVLLEANEVGRLCALTFEGGLEIPNDATFYIMDSAGDTIPILLPIYIRKSNTRPLVEVEVRPLSEYNSFVFDGSKSSDADGDALNFVWNFGDGGIAEGRSVTHRYENTGTFNATVTASDNSGQIGNSTLKNFTVKVNAPPFADMGEDMVSAPGAVVNFDGSASYDPDGKIVRYAWDFGDGAKAEGVKVSHSYLRSGHYRVLLRVEDDSNQPGNFGTDDIDMWINAPPKVEIGKDLAGSPGEAIALSGRQSVDSDGEITEYVWDTGDGGKERGREAWHSYEKPGKYLVTLTIQDDAGTYNSSASDQLTVVINDRPEAVFANDRTVVSVNEAINFDASGSFDRDGKITEYYWNFGDNNTATGSTVAHGYEYSGKYTVTLKIKDNSGTSSEYNETSKVMVINYPPVAKAGEDQWVTSSEVSFDASASSDYDGEITKYLWDFGDSFKSGEKMPVHIYSNPGKYLVKLTVTDDSKTSTKDHSDNLTVIVNSVPIADAGNDKISAPQEILKFDGSKSSDLDGEISSYEWDFGDGSSASGAKTSHSYAKPGIYSVTLTVRDNTGHTNAVSSDEAMVIVNQAPFALAGRDKVAAPGDKLVFDAFASYDSDGKVKSYHWEFSDGKNPSDLSRVERTFEEAGSYFAELTVTDNSGAINAVSKDKLDILINHPPQSNPGSDVFTNNLSVIFDGSASADADGDKLSYVWNLGDGSPMVSGAKIAHTYKKGGIYPVILTVDDGTGLKNAKNSATINIRINEAPVAVAGKDTTVCAGDMILFHGGKSSDPEGGVLKYFWDFGDDTKGEGINPTKVFDKGGVYTITLKVLDDTGFPENFDTDKMVVSVAESPIAYAGEDITAGVSEEIHFDGSQSTDLDGLVNSYNWDFGDGSSGGGPTPRHAYLEPGVYRVILTITGDKIGECSNQDSDDLMVTVHDAPVANFTCRKLVPVDLEVEFDGSGSKSKMAEISGWSWDFGDSAIAEGEKVSHIYTTPGRYIVTLKVTSDSQTGYNTGTVQNLIVVNSAPQSNAGEDKFVGIGQLVWFDGSGSSDVDGAITYYQWDFGDGITAEGVKARHQYVLSGRYSATLLLYDNSGLENKSDIDTLLVTVNEAPTPVIDCVARATVEESIEFNGANSYDADGVITGYYWDFADGAYGEGQKVQHSFARAGSYQVSLTVDDGYSLNNSRSTVIKNVIINHPPVPVAGNDRISAPEEMVEFDAGKSFDKDGVITQYKWDFADGNSIEGIKVGHIFAHPGIYNVVLTVTDDSETKSGMQSDTVQIQINSAPIAEGGTDREAFFGGAHDDVAFDAGLSSDPDGDPLTYVWEFGDGTSAKGARVSHKYLKPGKYTVNLKVDDNTGAKNRMSIDQFTVTVKSH